jgi:hypothetical protein
MVDGQIRKRDGKLVGDVDRARNLVEAARDYLLAETARRKGAAT